MADYCFPSNTTRDAMISVKKLWDFHEDFWYAYCAEGFIKDTCEGLLFRSKNNKPTKPVQRESMRIYLAITPSPDLKLLGTSPLRPSLARHIAEYKERKFRVKRIVGITTKSMGCGRSGGDVIPN